MATAVTRVSKPKKNNTNTSHEAQTSAIRIYAKKLRTTITNIFNISGSAYITQHKDIMYILSSKKNKTIIFYAVDRMSRCIKTQEKLKSVIDKNNLTLHFIREQIIYNKSQENAGINWQIIIKFLRIANAESANIGHRIRLAKMYKKQQGFYTGSKAPYGFTKLKVDGGYKLVFDQAKRDVLNFIMFCNSTQTKSSQSLNDYLQKCVDKTAHPKVDIICYDADGKKANTITDKLTGSEIACMLSDYVVDGKKWSSSKVNTILKNKTKYYAHICPNMDKFAKKFSKRLSIY